MNDTEYQDRVIAQLLADQERRLARLQSELVTEPAETTRVTARSASCAVLREVRVTTRDQDAQRMMTLTDPLKIATCDLVHVRRIKR